MIRLKPRHKQNHQRRNVLEQRISLIQVQPLTFSNFMPSFFGSDGMLISRFLKGGNICCKSSCCSRCKSRLLRLGRSLCLRLNKQPNLQQTFGNALTNTLNDIHQFSIYLWQRNIRHGPCSRWWKRLSR